MRKIILQLAVTLDGFIEGPNGEYDWCFTDGDYGMTEFLDTVDASFVGRKTYEMMKNMPESDIPDWKAIKEYVFSKTLESVEGNAILVKGDIGTEVAKIRAQQGKNIWLFGGASLTSSLLDLDLIDEFHLAVHPILLGTGKPLFGFLKDRKLLELLDITTYPSGLVMMKYASKK